MWIMSNTFKYTATEKANNERENARSYPEQVYFSRLHTTTKNKESYHQHIAVNGASSYHLESYECKDI